MLSGVDTTIQAVPAVRTVILEGALLAWNISKSNSQRLTHTVAFIVYVNRFCQHQVRRFYK